MSGDKCRYVVVVKDSAANAGLAAGRHGLSFKLLGHTSTGMTVGYVKRGWFLKDSDVAARLHGWHGTVGTSLHFFCAEDQLDAIVDPGNAETIHAIKEAIKAR
jgi:hypothetical protein